ncbi:hypothetical protein [Actinosynnema sp. NPDC020468]|uniref:hypothetical protein n=1 Tax=Actinosynnema sp. NPDC020468 TaxID=3154488 RepID=UPI00341004B5
MTTPAPAASRSETSPPPRAVDLARWLWIASALVGLGRFVVQLADRNALVDVLRQQQPGLNQDEIDAAVSGGVMFGLLLGGALVLIYTLLANRMARGRNWARIVLAVFGVVGIVVGVTRSITYVSGLAAVLQLQVSGTDVLFGLVTMTLDGAAVVLMFVPTAALYFRTQRSVSGRPPRVANGL